MEKKLKKLSLISLLGAVMLEVLAYEQCGIKVFALTLIPAALVFGSIWGAISAVSKEKDGK